MRVGQAVVGHDERRALGEADEVPEALASGSWVDGHSSQAELGVGDHGVDELRVVAQDHADPVARAQPGPTQLPRQSVAFERQVANADLFHRQVAVLEDEGQPVGLLLGLPRDQSGEDGELLGGIQSHLGLR